ncbi:MAG: DNA alkylation repair protein [bacterium]
MKIEYLKPLIAAFEAQANPAKAVDMKKYMKDQFEFYGIQKPERQKITQAFFEKYGLPETAQLEKIVRELWELPQREYQYFCQGMLEKLKKQMTVSELKLHEYMIVTKSWWDTVDLTAVKLVGWYFQKFPAAVAEKAHEWIESDNFWLQRTALLFQLQYKDKTDLELLFSLIKRRADSKEFFIRKAIGWVLREYSKTDPEAVKNFVGENELSPLSKREALRLIK